MANVTTSSSTKRRRRLESLDTTLVGVVVVVIVVVLVAASLVVKHLGVGYTHYTAEFLQAASLQSGNPVTVAGIEVGRVAGVTLDGDHVDADVMVRDDIHLGGDTKAAIKVATILGSRYLELVPGGSDALPNKTISVDNTEVPYDLQSLLNDATNTFDQVDSDQFAQSLAVLGKQLDGVPALVPQAMTNLHALSSIVADRRDQLGALLKSTQLVANTLWSQQGDLGQLTDQAQDLIGAFVARQSAFHAMLRALTNLVNYLDKIVVNDRPMFDDMLTSLRGLTDMVGQHDDLLRNVLQIAPVVTRQTADATGFGPTVEFNLPNGLAIDSWMCAISGRADQFGMIPYFKDCK